MGLEQANDETLAVNFGWALKLRGPWAERVWALGARLIVPASAGA